MNKTLSTTLIVLAVLVLAGGIFFAGTIYARSNMMFGWSNNNTYGSGMMSGNGGMLNMIGNYNGDNTTPANVSAEMTVRPEQAIKYAQKYLDKNISGAVAATNPIQFYGYYTLDYEKDGKVAGMLSVNGYSGQVFLHPWHGTFIEEAE
jgi:hypothetical protein